VFPARGRKDQLLTGSVYTPSAPRNPQHSGATPPTPRPRAFEAERVRAERQRLGVIASKAVHRHLEELPDRIPRGTRAAPIRGGLTTIETARGIGHAVAGRWGTHEGTAAALIAELAAAGYLARLVRPPCQLTAGATMAMLSRLSPLVEQIAHGRYRIHACRPDCLPDRILKTLIQPRSGDASDGAVAGGSLLCVAGSDASADPAPTDPLTARIAGNRERAWGHSPSGPSSASDGEQLWLPSVHPGAVAGSTSAPAGRAGARPRRPPASAPVKPLGPFTRSGWARAVPMHKHQQRAAALACRHLPESGISGTAAAVAAWLAGFEDQASSRTRASLARALVSLAARGLLVVDAGVWRLPRFVPNPVLELFDVPEAPSGRAPSPGVAAQLERNGVDPASVSHEEAVALSRRFFRRREQGLPAPRSVLASVREQALAELPTDLRAARRLDQAEARERLAAAMRGRGVGLWGADDYEVGHA